MRRTMLLTLICLAGAMHLPGQMVPPPLPQIQNPTQQAPDAGTQIDSLATGAAKRRLLREQTEALRLANQQRKMDMQAEIERRKTAAAPPAQGDQISAWKTAGVANGRFWNDLPPEQKPIFIIGFSDGLGHARAYNTAVGVENSYPAGLTAGEILKALDRFYDTPENIRIPIGLALTICRQRLAGLPEVDAQKNILVFRSAAAAIPAEKQ